MDERVCSLLICVTVLTSPHPCPLHWGSEDGAQGCLRTLSALTFPVLGCVSVFVYLFPPLGLGKQPGDYNFPVPGVNLQEI